MRSSSEKVRLCRFYTKILVSLPSNSMLEVTYSASISQEVRANRLNIAVVGLAKLTDGLEVLLASPAFRQDRERQGNLNVGHYCVGGLRWWGTRRGSAG